MCGSAVSGWALCYDDIYEDNPLIYQTLIERWNGTSWATVASPTPQAEQTNVLNAVTCVSASDCWAVGYYYAAIAYQTLIERWNGTSWAIVPSPNSDTSDNYLTDVTCVSTSDCWAVGRFLISGNNSQTLIERW